MGARNHRARSCSWRCCRVDRKSCIPRRPGCRLNRAPDCDSCLLRWLSPSCHPKPFPPCARLPPSGVPSWCHRPIVHSSSAPRRPACHPSREPGCDFRLLRSRPPSCLPKASQACAQRLARGCRWSCYCRVHHGYCYPTPRVCRQCRGRGCELCRWPMPPRSCLRAHQLPLPVLARGDSGCCCHRSGLHCFYPSPAGGFQPGPSRPGQLKACSFLPVSCLRCRWR